MYSDSRSGSFAPYDSHQVLKDCCDAIEWINTRKRSKIEAAIVKLHQYYEVYPDNKRRKFAYCHQILRYGRWKSAWMVLFRFKSIPEVSRNKIQDILERHGSSTSMYSSSRCFGPQIQFECEGAVQSACWFEHINLRSLTMLKMLCAGCVGDTVYLTLQDAVLLRWWQRKKAEMKK